MTGFFSRLFGREERADLNALLEILEDGAIVIDVRTKEEYRQGAARNSINIPLDVLSHSVSRFKKEQPIIVVCASGARSRSAAAILRSKGFSEVHDGGSWYNFNRNRSGETA